MAFNLVDLVKDQISSQVMSQLGNVVGGSSDVTEKAVGGALPSILQGLMGSASTSGGAESLFKAVQDQDDGILSNIGDLLGGGADSPFASAGSSVLSSLLGGGALGNLAGAIAGFSGLGKGKSSSLMGMIAPIVFSVIKRKVLGGGLNASSLASMMTGQKDNIAAAMPAGLSDHLDSSGFMSSIGDTLKGGTSAVTGSAAAAVSSVTDAATGAVGSVTDAASGAVGSVTDAASGAVGAAGDVAANTAKAGGSMLGKLIPVALLGLLAFFGLKFFGSTDEAAVETTTPAAVIQQAEPEQAIYVDQAAPAAAVSAAGTNMYTITQDSPMGVMQSVLTLNADGTGSIVGPLGESTFSGATVDGESFSFDVSSDTPMGVQDLTYNGVISGNTVDGVVTSPMGESPFSGARN